MAANDPGAGRTPQRWFTRKQAATLTGQSIDTLKRRERDGQLPNTRHRLGCKNRTIEYLYTDLVNAGLCEPVPADQDPGLTLRVVQDERRYVELSTELAQARTRVEMQTDLIDALQDELRHLRKLADKLAGGGR